MASRSFKQFLFSLNPLVSYIEGSFIVGASGAVSSTAGVGAGVTSITRKGTGQYQIQLSDNYYRFLGFNATVLSPTTGSGVTIQDGSLVVGVPYQIVFPSTSTNWQTLGLGTGLTAAVGMPFVATSGNSGGNGLVTRLTQSGIASVEVLPNPNLELGPLPTQGAYVTFQTLNTSNAPANPTSGTAIRFNIYLRNSTLVGRNETSTNY